MKEIYKNFLLLILTICAIMIISELVFRLFFCCYLKYYYDDNLYWKLEESQTGYQVFGYPRATIDDAGFRKDLRTGPIKSVLLGDSIAFGQSVKDEETIGYQLETMSGMDIVNMATPGWGLFQNAIRYKESNFTEGYVILVLGEQDMKRLPFDESEKHILSIKRCKNRLNDLMIATFIQERLSRISGFDFLGTANYQQPDPSLYSENFRYLSSIAKDARDRNARLIIVAYPPSETLSEWLKDACAELNAECILDMDEYMKDIEIDLIIEGEGHPSAAAYQIVAGRIYAELLSLESFSQPHIRTT